MQGKTSSLGQNISLSASRKTHQCNYVVDIDNCISDKSSSCLQDEDLDVPEIVEEIIEMLLTGLKDTVCLNDEIILMIRYVLIVSSLHFAIISLLFW